MQIQDFKVKNYDSAIWYEYDLPDGGSVCLEPCLGGFCVAKYDRWKVVKQSKVCTDLHDIDVMALIRDPNADYPQKEEAISKALEIAESMI